MNSEVLPGLYTPKGSCFSYSELKAIEVFDNNEPLVDLKQQAPHLVFGPPSPKMTPYTGEGLYIRKGVCQRLCHADVLLKKEVAGATLKILYAYRHPDVQRGNFDAFMQKSREQFPDLSEEELHEYVHHYMAIPEVAGHPAGAAIDMTYVIDGVDADMGAAMADFSDMTKVPVFSPTITKEQQERRILMRKVMMQAGFAPYDFEWWHFSYGDREWACYYGHQKTVYGPLEFSR